MYLSRLACYRGELETARVYRQTNLENARKTGFQSQIAQALERLAEISRLKGNIEEAFHYYQQSVSLAKEFNLTKQIDLALWGLGNTAVISADFVSAKRYFEESRLMNRPIEDIIGGIGWAYLGLGQLSEAKRVFQATLRQVFDTNLLPQGLDALVGMAHLAAQTGQLSGALELLTLVQQHSTNRYEIKMKVHRLWDELSAELPASQVAEAKSQGSALTFLKTVEALLDHIDTVVN